MKFLHKLLVFALLFVGVITHALAESFTVNGVVYRITDTGVTVNNLAKDNNLNGIVYVPEEVQYAAQPPTKLRALVALRIIKTSERFRFLAPSKI